MIRIIRLVKRPDAGMRLPGLSQSLIRRYNLEPDWSAMAFSSIQTREAFSPRMIHPFSNSGRGSSIDIRGTNVVDLGFVRSFTDHQGMKWWVLK
jgi:hypothetical protein